MTARSRIAKLELSTAEPTHEDWLEVLDDPSPEAIDAFVARFPLHARSPTAKFLDGLPVIWRLRDVRAASAPGPEQIPLPAVTNRKGL